MKVRMLVFHSIASYNNSYKIQCHMHACTQYRYMFTCMQFGEYYIPIKPCNMLTVVIDVKVCREAMAKDLLTNTSKL